MTESEFWMGALQIGVGVTIGLILTVAVGALIYGLIGLTKYMWRNWG
jgi:hypothetical protein